MRTNPNGLLAWRAASLCVVVWCSLPVERADSQTGTPANRQRVSSARHGCYHDDVHAAASLSPKAIDRALADLTGKISGVRPKSGPLDLESFKKALREALLKLKPSDQLKIISSAVCNVVDPKDVGGYWSEPEAIFFAAGATTEKTGQTKLDIDEKKFALSAPPLAGLEYSLASPRFAGQAVNPYGKSMVVLVDYAITVTVTVTFDRQSVEDGTGGTFSGVGSESPDPWTFTGTVSLTDRATLRPAR